MVIPDVQMFSLLFQFSPEGLYGNELSIHVILEDFEVQLLVFGSCFALISAKANPFYLSSHDFFTLSVKSCLLSLL